MSEQRETQSIELSWELDHPPEKVWRALTDPELLSQWLMANDMRLHVGHRFTFKGEPMPWWDGVVHSEVLELELGKRIQYSWRGGFGAAQVDTVVTWTLTPTPSGGTRLTLQHTGFVPENVAAFHGAKKGWERMVRQGLAPLLDHAGGDS